MVTYKRDKPPGLELRLGLARRIQRAFYGNSSFREIWEFTEGVNTIGHHLPGGR